MRNSIEKVWVQVMEQTLLNRICCYACGSNRVSLIRDHFIHCQQCGSFFIPQIENNASFLFFKKDLTKQGIFYRL